jgi:hypothetical protein
VPAQPNQNQALHWGISMHIVPTEVFRAAAEAIACLRPCLLKGRVTADQVKIALGEHLNVWPASIFQSEDGDVESQPRTEAPTPDVGEGRSVVVVDMDDLESLLAELDGMAP